MSGGISGSDMFGTFNMGVYGFAAEENEVQEIFAAFLDAWCDRGNSKGKTVIYAEIAVLVSWRTNLQAPLDAHKAVKLLMQK